VVSVASFIGADGTNPTMNTGRLSITLAPRGERKDDAEAILARLRPKLAALTGVTTYLQSVQDLQIDARASRTPYQFTLDDADAAELAEWAPKVIEELRALPALREVTSDFQAAGLGVHLTIDRDTASRLGVSTQAIDDVLYDAFGQRQISTIFTQLNLYRVVLQVKPGLQKDPRALDLLYVTSSAGVSVPLSTFVHMSETPSPLAVNHQGQFASVTISFDVGPGSSLGEAVEATNAAMARLRPPPGLHSGFQGTAQAFRDSLASEPVLVLAALITVYIVLGILYESTIHPITNHSTLPSAGVGAILALLVTRTEFTVIALIGIVLLIGIVKKNAIMMIDFALEAEREEGLSPLEAIHKACLLRFRPIMMTTMAALLGGIPLAIGTGSGSELRRPLGISIVGGLIVSQVLTLYTTPVIYLYMERVGRWLKGLGRARGERGEKPAEAGP
jgi:multidrug efflux pump